MRKTLILVAIIFMIIINTKKINANDYVVTYYFDCEINEVSVYYNPESNDYPSFYGYEFKEKIVNDKNISLYYETKYYNLIILGNGGTYLNLDQYIIKTIKHGESFNFSNNLTKDIEFIKENYNLIGYDREFENVVDFVDSDLILRARYTPNKGSYTFLINEIEYNVEQTYNEPINLPSFITSKTFIGFFDVNNNLVNNDLIINDLNEKIIYARFLEDIKVEESSGSSLEFSLFSVLTYKLNNGIYQNSPIFTDLESNKTYQLFVKYNGLEYSIGLFKTKSTNLDYLVTDSKITFTNNLNVKLLVSGNLIEGEVINDTLVFANLLEDKTYSFKNGSETVSIKTKKTFDEELINYMYKKDNLLYLILNINYTYLLNDEIIQSNKPYILFDNDTKFYAKQTLDIYESDTYKVLEKTTIHLENALPLNITQTNNTLTINNQNIDKLIFIKNKEFILDIYLFEDLDFNNEYLIISLVNGNYYINIHSFNIPLVEDSKIDIKAYSDKIIITNNYNYKIKFNDILYEGTLITIDNLNSLRTYYFEILINNVSYRQIFRTNDLLYNLSINDLALKVESKVIEISNLYNGYSYGLLKEGDQLSNLKYISITGEKVVFNNLLPNTNYTLYLRDIYGNDRVMLGVIKTNKALKNKPYSFLVDILNIGETSFTINNQNELLEYSLDLINWHDNLEITFNNLESFTNYLVYTRYKETTDYLASDYIITENIKTKALLPSINSLDSLLVTNDSISFKMLKGYNYYYNDNLITTDFNLNNLEQLSLHLFKIVRISDLEEVSITIKLKALGSLTNSEKAVSYLKTVAGITLLNSNKNLTYIIKNNLQEMIRLDGNSSNLLFNLPLDQTYQLYILKNSDLETFYLEEFVVDIYLPYNISDKLNNYLNNNNITINNEIKELINEALENSFNLNSKEEVDSLYLSTIEKINDLSKDNVLIIIITVIVSIIVAATIFIYAKMKGRKKI